MTCIGRLATAGVLLASAAFADVTMRLDYVFSGTLPVESLVATFVDTGINQVQLTLDTTGLSKTAHVKEWDFNLNPSLNPTSLTFTAIDGVPGTSPPWLTPPGLPALQADGYKADGDGAYDISFNFTPGFVGGALYKYSITATGHTLTAYDFAFLSVKNPASIDYKGPFFSAAQVQAPGGIHAWIAATPDGGTTLILLGGALLGLESLRRRFTA